MWVFTRGRRALGALALASLLAGSAPVSASSSARGLAATFAALGSRAFALRDIPLAIKDYEVSLGLWPSAQVRNALATANAWRVLAAIGVGLNFRNVWQPWIASDISGRNGGVAAWSSTLPAMGSALTLAEEIVKEPTAPTVALSELQTLMLGDIQELDAVTKTVHAAVAPYASPTTGAEAETLLAAEGRGYSALTNRAASVAAQYGITMAELTVDGLPVSVGSGLPSGWSAVKTGNIGGPHPTGWQRRLVIIGAIDASAEYHSPSRHGSAAATYAISVYVCACGSPDAVSDIAHSDASQFFEFIGQHVLIERSVKSKGAVTISSYGVGSPSLASTYDYWCTASGGITETQCMRAVDVLASQGV